jgi:mRNA interferase HigB
MRIIKEKTLKELYKLDRYKKAKPAIKSWINEVRFSEWNNIAELKAKYKNASIISSKRIVFNIKGNNYRLIVDIEYQLQIVFIVWFGTHDEYDYINAKTVNYDSKSYKNLK